MVVFLARLERLLNTITHPFDVACVGFGPYLSTERKAAEAEPLCARAIILSSITGVISFELGHKPVCLLSGLLSRHANKAA